MGSESNDDETLKDFLRRYGYYVPETEEEAQQLRDALSFILGALATKREVRSKARTALVWGVVVTITIAATKETGKALIRLARKILSGE